MNINNTKRQLTKESFSLQTSMWLEQEKTWRLCFSTLPFRGYCDLR